MTRDQHIERCRNMLLKYPDKAVTSMRVTGSQCIVMDENMTLYYTSPGIIEPLYDFIKGAPDEDLIIIDIDEDTISRFKLKGIALYSQGDAQIAF